MGQPAKRRTPLDAAKFYSLKLVRLNAPPEQIARGIALGCIVTSIPTFGLATPIAALLAPLFRANVVAATLGALLIGILPAPTAFAIAGGFIVGITPKEIIDLIKNFDWAAVQALGSDFFLAIIVFPLIFGSIAAVGLYFLTLNQWPRLRQMIH
ncbi:MAG: DUF2062 domain-containing protein [Anaerolineae bacterium]|nr:DUF2062 domain-containing protein [Gloeobacterales cyanobacterium ES-bin-313]